MTQPTADHGEDLLTTGAAAQLLGTTRQHVVNLCERGDLPFIVIGTHRRVRRHDVEALRRSADRLTADQRRSLRLGHALAGKIVLDPEMAKSLARRNLVELREAHPRGRSQKWFRMWEGLLDGPLDELLSALTDSATPVNRELRQNNPFAGLLTPEERERVLDSARVR